MNAPSNLTATAISETQINLQWKDNSSRESGFQIFQSGDGATFTNIVTVGRNIVSYHAVNLTPATKYYFTVRAYRNGQISAFSNTASATTLGAVQPPSGGIAARYPGDQNIGSDPDVILADDFEAYTSPSQLVGKWSGAGPLANMQIDTSEHFSGTKSLAMSLPISASEVLNQCHKDISPELTTIYMRSYSKFDDAFDVEGSSHNGIAIRAHYPGGAGTASDGTWFSAQLQNNKTGQPIPHFPNEQQPGYNQIYCYWPKQRDAFGDHFFSDGWVRPGGAGLWLLYPAQYPNFKPIPVWQPERGKWYCYELMVKANTVGKNDGEIAWWVDGRLDGRITDLVLRTVDVKINYVRIMLHATNSQRVNKKWYDNVVIAKSYIGPMA